jgi:uroporphyrinogen decarboxylase
MLTGKSLIEATLRGKPHQGNAFWVGHPSDAAKEIYYPRLGIVADPESEMQKKYAEQTLLLATKSGRDEIDLNIAIQSDMIWITPELDIACWQHPEGKPVWDCFKAERHDLGDVGIFADCEDIKEVEEFEWPDPDYYNFSSILDKIEYARQNDLAIFGGMWSPFFHIVADFFGMENYFIKMYTDPDVVHAVSIKVAEFLCAANDKLLKLCGDSLSAGFIGNDLGTQRSLIISPDQFKEFVRPYLRQIFQGIKKYNLKVAMHSCGSIDSIIPLLIEDGIDVLHPLQALAAGMEAKSLADRFGGRLIFLGGVDTQRLLPFGTPDQVRDEVLRLREILGPDFIVSPSHEALLANVPFENVLAMSKAAKE